MSESEFKSKFETEFRILATNFCMDKGAFGTLFKVFPKAKEPTIFDVVAIENPRYDYCSEDVSIIKVVPCYRWELRQIEEIR